MIPFTVAIFRLGLALAFGAIVGVEREWRQKHAGLKTMTLVSIGAAGFAMMSDTFGPTNHNPAQIAAAVVGGIGFIGAGVIMHRGLTVQGVTTAATLWADASVGVAAGLGQYGLSIALTVGIVVVQVMIRSVETMMVRLSRRPTGAGRFELRVDCASEAVHTVSETWRRLAAELDLVTLRRSITHGAEQASVRAVPRTPDGNVDLLPLEEKLVDLDGVQRVEVRHLGMEDE